jgi:polar amino acid transport system substrate-binding protein
MQIHYFYEGGDGMKGKRFLVLLGVFSVVLCLFITHALAGTLQDVKARGKLLAGVKTDFPPFGFVDEKGVNKGFDVDIAKALAKELFGKEEAVEFVGVTSGNRIAFLTTNKIDIILASMTITEERKKVIDYSIPYFMSGHLILVHKDSKIEKYQDLAGKKVSTTQGSTGDIVIGELVPTAQRVKFQHNSEALQALKDRRVEAFVQDDVLLLDLQKRNPELKIVGWPPFRPAPYGLGVRKGDKEWLEFVDATLTKMKKSGEYQKLWDKWFGEARTMLLKLE